VAVAVVVVVEQPVGLLAAAAEARSDRVRLGSALLLKEVTAVPAQTAAHSALAAAAALRA
jgi:hypothetical protein